MKLSDFDYNLPKNLIAQVPKKPRDHSRLLVFDRQTGKTEHKYFFNLVDYLEKGDVLVFNNSKVFPARLIGKKKETGGKVEIFLHQKVNSNIWECLVRGRVKEKQEIEFEKDLTCEIIKNNNDGTWKVQFNFSGQKFKDLINKIGQVPLPPYIKSKKARKQESKDYQTIYADDKKVGSVAAPTAGFHFTPELIKKLKNKGVQFEYVTLHVGLGTFAPVKIENIKKHKMHAEFVEIKKDVIKNIIQAKKEGRRIITVGTTSTRALEAVVSKISITKKQDTKKFKIFSNPAGKQNSKFKNWVDIFIYPGYKFKVVDAMITNFHLPKSTLLMLVSAFAKAPADKTALVGRDKIINMYKQAIKKKYRFFSYGDAMFIY